MEHQHTKQNEKKQLPEKTDINIIKWRANGKKRAT